MLNRSERADIIGTGEMMNWKKIGWSLLLLIILGAAGCNSADNQSRLGKLAITTQINQDNTPVAELALIVDTAPKIYLSVELINGRRGDRVRVTWRNLTKDQIVATETFTGRRQTDRPYEFIGLSTTPQTSWLASAITLTDISWPAGDYEAVVQLGSKETQQIGFVITTEQQFDIDAKKALVKNLWLGTQINSQNQIVSPSTKFDQHTEKIYAVVLLQNVPAGTRLKGSWQLLETGEVFSVFMTNFSGGGYLPFILALDEAGKTIWAKGNYSFNLFVDNVPVISRNFSIG